jgi:hypothetical protein
MMSSDFRFVSSVSVSIMPVVKAYFVMKIFMVLILGKIVEGSRISSRYSRFLRMVFFLSVYRSS